MLAALPAAMLVLPDVLADASAQQTSGPRPTQNPAAVPDGRAAIEHGRGVRFNLSAVSDYRFRGISQSAGKPAVQVAAEIAGLSGIYAGTWGSTIADYGGARFEVDAYAGYRTTVAGGDLDVGVISYLYPGADGASSAELYATATHGIGNATLKVGGSYTPRPYPGSGDGGYLFAEVEKPLPGSAATLRGHVGRESGVSTPTGSPKIDWLLGIDVHPGPVTLSIAWVAARYEGRNREPHDRSPAVLAIAFDF